MKQTRQVTLFHFNAVTRDPDVIELIKLKEAQKQRREEEAAMQRSIIKCFMEDGLVGIAKQAGTIAAARLTMPVDVVKLRKMKW